MNADTCPICGKPRNLFEKPEKFLPFCSGRCKNADLGKWLDGNYSVSRPLNEDDTWSLPEGTNDESSDND